MFTLQVIDSYLSLIATRSDNDGFLRVHSFKTYFYIALCSRGFAGVSRWTKNVDIFSKDLLFFPMNINQNHWVLIVCAF
jgi:sentrin-specific protease 1